MGIVRVPAEFEVKMGTKVQKKQKQKIHCCYLCSLFEVIKCD